MGAAARDIRSPGAGQAGDALLDGADVDPEEAGDACVALWAADAAEPRLEPAGDQRLREGAAAGLAAGAAIRVGQHVLHGVDPRVFGHVELATRSHEQRRQQQAEPAERRNPRDQIHRAFLRAFPAASAEILERRRPPA
jgi:hypothetical protein